MSYVPATESAKQVRDALKEAGIKANVRTHQYAGGATIRVEVKAGSVALAAQITRGIAERIDRDPATGEILSGCNRYVDVQPHADLLKAKVDELSLPILATVSLANADAASHQVPGTDLWVYRDGNLGYHLRDRAQGKLITNYGGIGAGDLAKIAARYLLGC